VNCLIKCCQQNLKKKKRKEKEKSVICLTSTSKPIDQRALSLTCLKLNTPVFALRDAMSFSSISSGTALESVTRKENQNIL